MWNWKPRIKRKQTGERLDAAGALFVVRKQELELLVAGTREEEKREAKARLDEAEQAWNLAKKGYRSEEIAKAKAASDAAQAAHDVIREQKKEFHWKTDLEAEQRWIELLY